MYQLLACNDNVILLADNIDVIMKNKEALFDASEEVGLERNRKLSMCWCLVNRMQVKIET
jgi:hypothetical protein